MAFFLSLLTYIKQEEIAMKNKTQVKPSILLRRSEGYFTITELADELGVDPATVWKWADMGSILKPSHRWKNHTRRYYQKVEFNNILEFLGEWGTNDN